MRTRKNVHVAAVAADDAVGLGLAGKLRKPPRLKIAGRTMRMTTAKLI
jgi:hypothetical protein